MNPKPIRSQSLLLSALATLLLSGCIHLRQEPKEAEPDPLVTLKEELKAENEESQRLLEEKLARMIRNEIVPELREVSMYSRKVIKKQNDIKSEALQKIIIGRVEWVKIADPLIMFRARIDTGAQTCSIHAEKI